MERIDELIHEIGTLIISNKRYTDPEPDRKIHHWDTLALVFDVAPTSGRCNGYVYDRDQWEPEIPENRRPILENSGNSRP